LYSLLMQMKLLQTQFTVNLMISLSRICLINHQRQWTLVKINLDIFHHKNFLSKPMLGIETTSILKYLNDQNLKVSMLRQYKILVRVIHLQLLQIKLENIDIWNHLQILTLYNLNSNDSSNKHIWFNEI